MDDDGSDSMLKELRARAHEMRLRQMLGLRSIESLKGCTLPGLGTFHAISDSLEGDAVWVWYNDEKRSTRIIELHRLELHLEMRDQDGQRRARGSSKISRLSQGEVHAETEIDTHGDVEVVAVARTADGDYSETRSAPAWDAAPRASSEHVPASSEDAGPYEEE